MIKCLNVSKKYSSGLFNKNSIEVLKNINLQVPVASIFGITGESGCGKTTLAECIMGLLKFEQGNIFINKKSIFDYKNNKQLAREMQMIQQNPESALDSNYTVKHSLDEIYSLHKSIYTSKNDFQEELKSLCYEMLIDDTNLDKLPYSFSGGQLQRICIIRALLVKPKILILDEPTSMLDVSVQVQIVSLLLKLKARFNLTLLWISHDLNLMEKICDYIAIMKNGKIIETGDCTETFLNPKNDYTKILFESKELNIISAKLEQQEYSK